MIDVKNCKRRDGGEFVIYSTEGKNPKRPLIVGSKDPAGEWYVTQYCEDGHIYSDGESPYDLVERHPLDGVEPGTPVLVWRDSVSQVSVRCFVSLKTGDLGEPLIEASYGDRVSFWPHGLTLEQYAARYLK